MGTPASIPVPEPEVALCRVLTRHHLLNRTETGSGSLVDVADDVVGLHATIPATPYLSLHERIRRFDSTDLDDALYGRRSLVRLKAMRGTVFVVSRRLAPVVFAATRAATTASDRRWLGTNEQAYARLTPKVLAALAGRSLTVRELRKTIGADADLSGIVAMLCDEGRIVRDRPVGSRHSSTFRYRLWTDAFPGVRLDEWDEDTATQELVRLYLDSYGPASRADLIWWTGLPARRIDEAIDRLGAVLTTVSVTGLGNRLLMTQTALHDTKTTDPTTSAVQLLPKLDPYTMGYKDRSRMLDPRHNEMVIDRGGNVTSVVLAEGRVVGVWDLVEDPNAAIRVLLFDPDHRDRRLILERAAESAAFWFGEPVAVEEYTSMVPLRQRSGVMRQPLDAAQPRGTRLTKPAPGPRRAAAATDPTAPSPALASRPGGETP